MITLFVIVVIATLVLAVTRAEGMRPLGLALVGMISLVLGARTTVIFTETSIAPLVSSVVLAQESTADAEATDENGDTPEVAETEPAAEAATAAASDAEATETEAIETEASDTEASDAEATDAEATETEASDAEATNDEASAVEADTAEAEALESPETTELSSADAEASAASVAPASDDDATLALPLKIEPVTNVNYLDRDESTPEWLETKAWSQDGVFFAPVASRLQISEEDRDTALDREIKQATDAYINRLLKNKHATTLLKLRSAETLPKVMGSFQEQVEVRVGTMHQAHALLSFDKDFQNAVKAEWDEVRATSRLMQTGLGVGIVILLLSTMFSYFKLDTATRGYYTGRLQFAAAAAILAVIAVSVLFANYVPWM